MKGTGVLLAILAIVAGLLLLVGWLSANIVIGVWLLVYGIITLIRR